MYTIVTEELTRRTYAYDPTMGIPVPDKEMDRILRGADKAKLVEQLEDAEPSQEEISVCVTEIWRGKTRIYPRAVKAVKP